LQMFIKVRVRLGLGLGFPLNFIEID